jgi:putative nucleotidyltransferase with HDIG domain
VSAAPAAQKGPLAAIRRGPPGHGRRLLDAIAAFERFPALGYSRDRLIRLLGRPVADDEIVGVIESDPALTIGVLALANKGRKPADPICGVPAAFTELSSEDLGELASALPTYDYLSAPSGWGGVARSFRLHAIATLRATERLLAEGHGDNRDALRVAALLHDIGKPVLLHAYGRYGATGGSPAERALAERTEWGMDHTTVGGVLARRLGLPACVASLIEGHHADDAEGDSAVLQVADMLAHFAVGSRVEPRELVKAAAALGLKGDALDAVLYELPSGAARPRRIQPSPLTKQQTAAIRLLAKGERYKQIGQQLGLATSTVRSHLFNAYTRLGVSDRTQAVLVATERGWL